MKYIDNRDFILIKPKKPFVDWINGHDDDVIPEETIYSDNNLYMIKHIDITSSEEIEKNIKKKYKEIFENELWSWYEDEDYFPKNITFKMFKDWFEYEYIEICYDTENSKIIFDINLD